jgi:hypothetical protein
MNIKTIYYSRYNNYIVRPKKSFFVKMVDTLSVLGYYIGCSYVYMAIEGVISDIFYHDCGNGCQCSSYYAATAIAPFTAPVVLGRRIMRWIR